MRKIVLSFFVKEQSGYIYIPGTMSLDENVTVLLFSREKTHIIWLEFDVIIIGSSRNIVAGAVPCLQIRGGVCLCASNVHLLKLR